MSKTVQNIGLWLMLGPVLALLVSIASWYVIDQFSPDRLTTIEMLFNRYPQGLLLSLMTPWGWLMYGGLVFMYSKITRLNISCTIAGAVLFGGFWPIWMASLVNL
ncbi:MAG: hypothetical protein OEZ15_07180 [Gammaproteobacteria bacterium]|nr:hypothetical protein [Gammaproteobacteria bacterium]